jgi:flagella basal body P-ring formation protein FlgA
MLRWARQFGGGLAVLGAMVLGGVAEGALVQFRPSAIVRTAVVTLGDIAEIADDDQELAARLRAVTLGPSPAPGRNLSIDFQTVRSRLSAVGVNVAHVEFTGTSVVTVTQEEPQGKVDRGTRIPDSLRKKLEADVGEAVALFVEQQVKGYGRLTGMSRLEDEHIYRLSGSASPKFTIRGGKPPFNQPQEYEVNFNDRDGRPQRITVLAQVRPLPKVVVARRPVEKGAVLEADDLEAVYPEANKTRSGDFEKLETLIGLETTRSLRAGEPLVKDDLRSVPLIRSGDVVTVYSRRGGITVRTEARARGTGAAGEIVSLVSLDGRGKYQGRVTGYHAAEIVAVGDERDNDGGDPPGRMSGADRQGR